MNNTTEYGELSNTRGIIARYENGFLKEIYDNVVLECMFVQQDYHLMRSHVVSFKRELENGKLCESYFNLTTETSFQIFPWWMKERLESSLQIINRNI